MNNFLEEYLKQQHQQEENAIKTAPGPVLTISREFGCEAKELSRNLAHHLNTYFMGIGDTQKWEIISKEILEESAKALKTNADKIEYIFKFEKRTQIDDFFLSMTSMHYQSDWKVREAVKDVVEAFANKGHAIIIGRAGAQITRHIQKSLHVKLTAPFNWRVSHIKEKYQITEKLANKKVREMDANRQKLLEMFSQKFGCHNCYDVHYNVSTLSLDIIVSDIVHMMQLKKLI
jgi:cytidylate kinase